MEVHLSEPGAPVQVLAADPDLGVRLPAGELERARNSLAARGYVAEVGSWALREPVGEPGAFGLLVVDGLLALRTEVEERATLELVGRGDLLQPWVQLGPETTVTPTAGWEVLQRATVLLLDRRFAEAAGPWPEIAAELMQRLVIRGRRLCYQLAVNNSPRTDERILYTLWGLADRWGRVREGQTLLEVPLTHQHLADLVCATRPSVSAALNNLRDAELISYARDWFVLHGRFPHQARALRAEATLKP